MNTKQRDDLRLTILTLFCLVLALIMAGCGGAGEVPRMGGTPAQRAGGRSRLGLSSGMRSKEDECCGEYTTHIGQCGLHAIPCERIGSLTDRNILQGHMSDVTKCHDAL